MFHHDFFHQQSINAITQSAPPSVKSSLNDIWQAAMSANIPWLKIAMAFGTMLAGGFSPASIAAAISMLFGNNPPTNLAHMAKATSTAIPTS